MQMCIQELEKLRYVTYFQRSIRQLDANVYPGTGKTTLCYILSEVYTTRQLDANVYPGTRKSTLCYILSEV